MLISFCPLLLWITAENRTKLKKLFIWTTKSGATQHHKHSNCTWLFIRNFNNAIDILDWTWFVHSSISDCRNSFNNKLKNLWTSRKFLLSEESLKGKRHMFIGMCSLFTRLNMQIVNLCHRWHGRILKPLKYASGWHRDLADRANVCYCENEMFL